MTLVVVELYARNFDGWGAWATGPLFLIPVFLSLVIAGATAFGGISEFRAGKLEASTVLRTGIAAIPLIWVLVRRYVV